MFIYSVYQMKESFKSQFCLCQIIVFSTLAVRGMLLTPVPRNVFHPRILFYGGDYSATSLKGSFKYATQKNNVLDNLYLCPHRRQSKYHTFLGLQGKDKEDDEQSDQTNNDSNKILESLDEESNINSGKQATSPVIEAPTVKSIIRFAIPAIGIWLCGPLLSLIDTSAVGMLSGTSQQAALNPAITITDDGALLVVSRKHHVYIYYIYMLGV